MKEQMNAPTSGTSARWPLAIALAGLIVGVGSLALVSGGRAPVKHEETLQAPSPRQARGSTGLVAGRGGAHVAEAHPALAASTSHESSVVGRLSARYRPEDLQLLSAVSRRTNAPPSPMVHRLLDAARAGADDVELTRMIREDVQGALVRHDCFDWLRRRRGEPRPKPPALASQRHARAQAAR